VVDQARAETLKAYDAIAPLYAEYSARYRAYLDAVDELVIERMESGARLLDLGSGDGRRLGKIAGRCRLSDVVCVEPSAEMAALCRQNTGFPVHSLSGEDLDRLPEAGFDVVTALWNVLGHMPDSASRLEALVHIKAKLAPGGNVMLDVNNRHNRRSYGRLNVWKRRVVDSIAFDEKRGDARFEWRIGDQSFPASGHLFTPAEIEDLFRKAGLAVAERLSVDYRSGAISVSRFDGQLFFRLRAA
jgi:SAM-dependent methyltransferase